jgi:nucleotide-binding universal stress UspA family protein
MNPLTAQQPELPIHNILVATDFSPASEKALQYGLTIGTAFNATIHLAHVIPKSLDEVLTDQTSPKLDELEAAAKERLLKEQAELASVPNQVYVQNGVPYELLDQLIQERKIDLAIVGAHGVEGFKRFLRGSIAEQIFRTTSCPVLTIGPDASVPNVKSDLKSILFAADLLFDESRALVYAALIANRTKGQLSLLHVMAGVTPPQPNETVSFEKPYLRKLRNLLTQPGVVHPDHVNYRLAYGEDTADAILAAAGEIRADLIVLSVHPEEPWTTHLPDKAYRVVAQAWCPVLTVRETTV